MGIDHWLQSFRVS